MIDPADPRFANGTSAEMEQARRGVPPAAAGQRRDAERCRRSQAATFASTSSVAIEVDERETLRVGSSGRGQLSPRHRG